MTKDSFLIQSAWLCAAATSLLAARTIGANTSAETANVQYLGLQGLYAPFELRAEQYFRLGQPLSSFGWKGVWL